MDLLGLLYRVVSGVNSEFLHLSSRAWADPSLRDRSQRIRPVDMQAAGEIRKSGSIKRSPGAQLRGLDVGLQWAIRGA